MGNRKNNERANRSGRKARAFHLRRHLQRRWSTRPCEVMVERVEVPNETHVANESTQPLLEQPSHGIGGPICRSGIVRHEVDTRWPIGHQLFYRCRFQVG